MAVIGMKVYARGLLFDPRAGGVTPDEAMGYALSADVDVVVVGCDDVDQVRANAGAARRFVAHDRDARCAIVAKVREAAEGLAYYRAPRTLV
jgi:hypothetical protein